MINDYLDMEVYRFLVEREGDRVMIGIYHHPTSDVELLAMTTAEVRALIIFLSAVVPCEW